MNKRLLIVFGKPGAGKSYVAQTLENRFGYFSYNGDDALPPDMKEKLFQKAKITDGMRKQFLENMIGAIKQLSIKHDRLVVHQTFLKEFMRKKLLDEIPNVTFLLIETNNALREKRYIERKDFNLGLSYLRQMTDLFEPISIPHEVIYNNTEGAKNIIKQLQKIVV